MDYLQLPKRAFDIILGTRLAPLKKLDSTQRRKDTKDAEYHKLFPSVLKVYHILATLRYLFFQ
ncbi:MAG: hypothetical protein DRI81_17355 [Chloroflexi bacterium]|nr:MAG: hypothetical protein DRI81_17355 [Chloroflexota bacterium]